MNTIPRLGLLALLAGLLTLPAAAQQRDGAPQPERARRGQLQQRDQARGPQARVEQRLRRLDQQLDLTERQETEIRRLLTARLAQHPGAAGDARARRQGDTRPGRPHRPEGRVGQEAARPPRDPQRQARMRAEVDQTNRAIIALLTPRQAETFQRMIAAQQARKAHRPGDRPGEGRAARPGGRSLR